MLIICDKTWSMLLANMFHKILLCLVVKSWHCSGWLVSESLSLSVMISGLKHLMVIGERHNNIGRSNSNLLFRLVIRNV